MDGRTNIAGELSSDAAETVTTALNAFMDPPADGDDLTNGGLGPIDGQHTGPLDRRDIERLLCDSPISRVITGPRSEALDVGRATRAFPDPTRRAITARDRECRWPGCATPAGWCEIHHHDHWEHGGETSAANGVLLCTHHHRFLHRNPRWTTTFHEQHFRVSRPDSTELTRNPWTQLAA